MARPSIPPPSNCLQGRRGGPCKQGGHARRLPQGSPRHRGHAIGERAPGVKLPIARELAEAAAKARTEGREVVQKRFQENLADLRSLLLPPKGSRSASGPPLGKLASLWRELPSER